MIEKINENIDQYVFMRKKRSLFFLIHLLAVVASNYYIDYYVPGISFIDIIIICVLGFIPAYFSLLAIEALSSHDIGTWKHSTHVKLWIYLGCYVSLLLGVVVYYYLKWKENKYLTNLDRNIKN